MRRNRLLLLAILLLGVGFALVSTTLYLNGNVKISTNNADFDVKFTKAVLDGTDVSADVISTDGKTITYVTKNLSTVGDISKLDFEITNNSTMYDAEVSIEITVNEATKDYYEITKEIPTSIEGKRTAAGKIEISLIKASTEDIQGTFTCTLKATAIERTEKAKGPYRPKYFAFGTPTADSSTTYTTLTYSDGSPAKVFVGLDEDNQKSICIIYNGSLECFKSSYAETQVRMQEVFGENFSYTSGPIVAEATANDLYCYADCYNIVKCRDEVTGQTCKLDDDSYYAECYTQPVV